AHPDGKMELVSADDFSELFTRHQPGVVVLQSCEGGTLSASKAFVGIASQIVQQNIPVVVAMQYQVSNSSATRFAQEFYKRLAEHDPVDLAVQEGRRQIALGPAGYNRRDFATPNLFMRVRDGHLFQLPAGEEDVSAGQKTPGPEKTVMVVSGEGRRFACLIGTNEYDDPDLPGLSYPEDNMDALKRLLKDKQIGDFDEVVVLQGKTHTDVIGEIKRTSGQL
ncbi:MAG: CHAT domain-containing protein, partial [bacterium]|nr:CHAT domain-containing protein [bacterium]